MVIVAQLVRALDCGSKGRGFESRLSPLSKKRLSFLTVFFIIKCPLPASFSANNQPCFFSHESLYLLFR